MLLFFFLNFPDSFAVSSEKSIWGMIFFGAVDSFRQQELCTAWNKDDANGSGKHLHLPPAKRRLGTVILHAKALGSHGSVFPHGIPVSACFAQKRPACQRFRRKRRSGPPLGASSWAVGSRFVEPRCRLRRRSSARIRSSELRRRFVPLHPENGLAHCGP